jgi:VWFA-related protein
MRSRVRGVSAGFYLLVGFFAGATLKAQQPQQVPPSQSQATGPVLRTTVNEVLVPVVVRDAQGHSVGGLTKDDFQVFDNGKPQTITGFSIVHRDIESAGANSPSSAPEVGESPSVAQLNSPTQRFVVFLFDDLNLTFDDLPHVQEAAIKALDSSLASEDFAAVLSTSGVNSGLTRDHTKLRQAIQDLKLKTLLPTNGHACYNVDYYQGDRIVNKNDDWALQAVIIQVLRCVKGITPEAAEAFARADAERAVIVGEQNYRANLYALRLIMNKLMAPLPGQHVIVLISPGFFTSGPDALAVKSEVLDIAARSNTAINTLDARGLYTTNLAVEVTNRVDQASQRLINQYREQSMDANTEVMEELADGTGGTFFHNNNDLEGGVRTLVSGAEYRYVLAFPVPNAKPKVQHSLKVKVDRTGLIVQARRGYAVPAPEKRKK